MAENPGRKAYLASLAGVSVLLVVAVGLIAFLVIKCFMAPGSKYVKVPLFAGVILVYAGFRLAEARLRKRFLGD